MTWFCLEIFMWKNRQVWNLGGFILMLKFSYSGSKYGPDIVLYSTNKRVTLFSKDSSWFNQSPNRLNSLDVNQWFLDQKHDHNSTYQISIDMGGVLDSTLELTLICTNLHCTTSRNNYNPWSCRKQTSYLNWIWTLPS